MQLPQRLYFTFAILISYFIFSCNKEEVKTPLESNTLFVLKDSTLTGVSFTNKLTEGPNTNVLMYEYFYNGGGIAVGDFNNDGMEDLYFTGNMVENKLYLNSGDFKFDDVTSLAGVGGRPGPWTTGVTVADVDGDGLLDIYVCYSGNLPTEKRKNQLFINQGPNPEGIPVFKDLAPEMGLDHASFSTQALFFDMDKDGDLDMFLLNHNPKSLPVLDEYSTKELLKQRSPSGSQLFRNDDGIFVEVTEQAGIQNSELSYGLGIGAADLNGDGWTDLYVSNDYTAPDYLYINNQDGTFTNVANEALGHVSQFSMGNELADYNNDGLIDILTLDMLPEDNRRQKLLMSPDNYEKHDYMVRAGLHHQVMRNMLHRNNGTGYFSEIGQVTGISNTDWSWSALLADFDNDGWKDLYITNGYLKDYTNLDFLKYMGDYVQTHNTNLKRENILELVSQIPASDLHNYSYRNSNGNYFENNTETWGLSRPSNSNGAAYVDLNNDGTLDLVVNNINAGAFIFENRASQLYENNFLQLKLNGEGKNTQGIGSKVTIYAGTELQVVELNPTRGYQSSVTHKIHFGLGHDKSIDSLVIEWPSGKFEVLQNIQANQLINLNEEQAELRPYVKPTEGIKLFTNSTKINSLVQNSNYNDFKRQALLINPISGIKAGLGVGDLNGDGMEDIVVGGLEGVPLQVLYQNRAGEYYENNSNRELFGKNRDSEDTSILLADLNGNGHLDIYVGCGGYGEFMTKDPNLQDRVYFNDGKGNFTLNSTAIPITNSGTSVVLPIELNKQGLTDLFIGGSIVPGQYPEFYQSYFLQNQGDGKFELSTIQLPNKTLRNITDAAWFDINDDGKKELILVGEWSPISIFTFENNTFSEVTDTYFPNSEKGWWTSIEVGKTSMGKTYLISGNYGRNSQLQTSKTQPVELYYKDFDNNGSLDPILTSYIQGKSYPFLTRDELLDQFSNKRNVFTSYASYADAQLDDVFSKEESIGSEHLKVDNFDTKFFLLNQQFEEIELPIEVQFAPVHHVIHLSSDDPIDRFLFLGNYDGGRLRLGKTDANQGILVTYSEQNELTYVPQRSSGLAIIGQVIGACLLQNNKVLVQRLNNNLESYEFNVEG